ASDLGRIAARHGLRPPRRSRRGVQRDGVSPQRRLSRRPAVAPGPRDPGGLIPGPRHRYASRAPYMAQLLARKPISELVPDGEQPLKRVLGAGDLIMLAIGAVIGAGIFSSIGTAAAGEVHPNGDVVRYGAGPALVLSFVLLGVVCGLAALCYAELASIIPQAGSAYAYSYATLGELIAWIIGWDLILEYAVGNIAVAIAWSGYFTSLLSGFGIEFPAWLTHGYRTALLSSNAEVHALLQTAPRVAGIPILLNIPAALIVLAMPWILYISARDIP